MESMTKVLNCSELENAVGAIKDETSELFANLLLLGYGRECMTEDYCVDVEKIKGLFAERGFKFKPSESGENFFEKDGLLYGQDYIIYLIKNGELF